MDKTQNLVDYAVGIEKLQIITKVACTVFHVDESQIFSNTRVGQLREPRQIIQYLATKMTKLSLSEIGKRTGNKDHATVLHAKRKVLESIEPLPSGVIPNEELANAVRTIENSVRSYFGEQPVDVSEVAVVLETTNRVKARLENPNISFDIDESLDFEQRARLDLSNPFIEIQTLESTLEQLDNIRAEVFERLQLAKEKKNEKLYA